MKNLTRDCTAITCHCRSNHPNLCRLRRQTDLLLYGIQSDRKETGKGLPVTSPIRQHGQACAFSCTSKRTMPPLPLPGMSRSILWRKYAKVHKPSRSWAGYCATVVSTFRTGPPGAG